ncbi:MAG: GntR family transcriptional regulator, partial [Rhodobacteraceae bacterium]|nr:GntR family transcriptional regulator [Paracoccaceae bacterium]
SRTIARLAMSALERDGLLAHSPRRGYRVRGFTITEVADAIAVRGELEAMAARLVAERGPSDAFLERLETLTARSAALLGAPGFGLEARAEWARWNRDFHVALVEGCGNTALREGHAHVSRVPLAAPEVMVFRTDDNEMSRRQLRRAHGDHEELIAALRDRRGTRAAEIMRAHAERSAFHKRRNYSDLREQARIVGGTGLALVVPGR